jgi:hypothetical protein
MKQTVRDVVLDGFLRVCKVSGRVAAVLIVGDAGSVAVLLCCVGVCVAGVCCGVCAVWPVSMFPLASL